MITTYGIVLFAVIVVIGTITLFALVPFVKVLVKQAQLSNNTAVPFPPLPGPPPPEIRSPPYDPCSHGSKNQTLQGGIVCLPQDQKNMSKLNNEGRGNI